ncbi:MAG TPA: L-threonylcarbamoyladenylate synthase [Parvularculaceae bacterium]|nr:L-threonylcarbamoyladenylate synthase [Parvularculaceae bacterium]
MAIIDRTEIKRAAEILRAGGLVAIPTETVYGLAADATNDKAVARIFEAKGRPRFNPLIVHVTSVEAARAQADFSPLAEKLVQAFWPGPLTLVLPRRGDSKLSLLVSAGLDTIALRAPAHPIARAVIEAARLPLAAPSANRSGALSPTSPAHVKESLGDTVDMILDGGTSAIGLESTILKIDGDEAVLLRPGGLALADIEGVIGKKAKRGGGAKIEAPGMMESHYAPRAPLRLNAEKPESDEAFLAFGPAPLDHPHTLNLSAKGDLREAAANFFAHLRALDALAREKKLKGIAAAPVPSEGLGEAINDRLTRAAAAKRA